MKRSSLAVAVTSALLFAGLALAEPRFSMTYPAGVPRAHLEGNWANSQYSVWRAPAATGDFQLVGDSNVLCTGQCFLDDYSALPGATYLYRFELTLPDGSMVTFGPYSVRIDPVLARRIDAIVTPNPGWGSTRVTLFLAGPPGSPAVRAEARLFDLQGRRLATLHNGPLAPGRTTMAWNGRDDGGHELGAGTYFLRLVAADGRRSITRVLRLP